MRKRGRKEGKGERERGRQKRRKGESEGRRKRGHKKWEQRRKTRWEKINEEGGELKENIVSKMPGISMFSYKNQSCHS